MLRRLSGLAAYLGRLSLAVVDFASASVNIADCCLLVESLVDISAALVRPVVILDMLTVELGAQTA